MNRFFAAGRWTGFEGEGEDGAAMMRCLAGLNVPSGEAVLRLERRTLRRLESALTRARRLERGGMAEDEALSRLVRDGRLAENCARRAIREGGQRLPAWSGRPRIEAALEALCAGGDAALSLSRLMDALKALDAAQPLTTSELWAVPDALRVALSRCLADVALSIAGRAERAAQGAAWARRPTAKGLRRDVAFLTSALSRAESAGSPRARHLLERALLRLGLSAEDAARQAQASAARDELRLSNLLDARRLLEDLRWRDCFERLSRVDGALRAPSAGCYREMDEESRGAVREEVARIARRLELPEIAVAQCAADAAREGEGLQGDVCWWLRDDEGRKALFERLGRSEVRLPRLVPDPRGRRTVAALLMLTALLWAALTRIAGDIWLCLPCLFAAWTAASAVIGRLYPLFFRPARLLKLELERVPDDLRTLVTLPVLLSDINRVDEACDRLEALGCLEADPNIEYLLLGDFADAVGAEQTGDAAVLARARERIAGMNARAGREKYAFLHRSRTLLKPDGIWMGRDRKRGALMDLNRLLLGLPGAEHAFSAENAACARLRGRFALVVTLDADTRVLPDELRRMIGAMAHPLNRPGEGRGYAVLQPRMEMLPSACVNGFVALFAGNGGLNAYPVAASDLWQDVTGCGIYAGKGIYDVAAFYHRLEGALPEGRILSHDLVEGSIAGAGRLNDVACFDGYPGSLAAALRRQNRWMRGDWQLLPLLLSRGPLPNGARLDGAARYRMADNLVRSLRAPALLALLLAGAWTGNAGALLAALAVVYLEPALQIGGGDALKWRRATAELALLPAFAGCALDAACRTLWRLVVSGRRLMEWVTAADAEKGSGDSTATRLPGFVAALLLVPGLFNPGWALASAALMALFLVGPGWIRDMEHEPIGKPEIPGGRDRSKFEALARETWRFFEAVVPPEGSGLPPDNWQLDPPVGPARRTSPTNIALYMLGCVSAMRLGFIGVPEARARMARTVATLEGLEKWRGNPYNWYDIDALAPLRPRYVSSVDGGNLAAALLLCAAAPETGSALARRMRALAEGMDLAALYDEDLELFAVGMDVESGRLSASHYDLLASEARMLSFVAMMLGQVPIRHWRRLGRACTAVAGGVVPLSWSGTMFEYLMPELFLRAPANTLLGEGVRAAVEAQRAQGRRAKRPWGISESGYCAFDAALNYQYRAFGLGELALEGNAVEDVIAPYATALAAMLAPRAAAENLRRMTALGWRGEWGLYEAADCLRPDGEGRPSLVKSHMAHHQGMILCALCNVLTGDSLCADFMRLPEARALSLLLEERPCESATPRGRDRLAAYPAPGRVERRHAHRLDGNSAVPGTWLLHGDGATALWTSDGAVYYARFGVNATRFSGDLQDRRDRACVHLRDEDRGAEAVLGGEGSRTACEPGGVEAFARLERVEAALRVCVSPEDGTLYRSVELRNAGDRVARLSLTDAVPVALASDGDWQAHAIYQNLFVESARLAGDGLLFRRRPRSPEEKCPVLVHAATPAPSEFETDYERLVGRTGDTGHPGGITGSLSGGTGDTLNPVSALRVRLTLAPGQRTRVTFALALLEEERMAGAWLERSRNADRAERAMRLASMRARAMLGFLGLKDERHALLQRMAALLADGRLAAQARGPRPGEPGTSPELLWPLGLSGDRPMLLVRASGENLDAAREAVRAHAFFHALGLEVDLMLVDDGEGGYARPLRDAMEAMIAASHLNRLRRVSGGAWLLDGGALTEDQRRALERSASAAFDAGGDFYAQLRRRLSALDAPRGMPIRPLDIGASTLRRGERLCGNGFGGFLPEGGYAVDVAPDRLPPAPWCNILANDAGGALLSERGGGFFWRGNSRSGRLTPYGNDALWEGWGITLWLLDEARGEALSLLPGVATSMPFEVRYDAGSARYAFETRRLAGAIRFAQAEALPETRIEVRLENRNLRSGRFRLLACVNWLMGTDARDAVRLNAWHEAGACLVTGAMPGSGYLAFAEPGAQAGPGRAALLGGGDFPRPMGLAAASGGEGWSLALPVRLSQGEEKTFHLALGWAGDAEAALARAANLREECRAAGKGGEKGSGGETRTSGPKPLEERLVIETPVAGLNRLANDFLLHQVRASRVLGRAGLYQPGGAYGFRDQLQDMLALLQDEPERVRAHLLRCAARQFEDGDVLHWWHESFTGVRTRVSDDLLFLPWVTAAYVRRTGDAAVLEETVTYLEPVEIPEGREDVYREMRPGTAEDTLHGHCMRALRRAARFGAHGLLLMGTGDWNDGMNRVGNLGRGESVWLTEFWIACAQAYREIAGDAGDRAWLSEVSQRLRPAVENFGWDGNWYLRAYADDGEPLGSAACAACRIDAISQAWAVLAGLDPWRCRRAMDAAWELLADEEHGLIRLLTPPFDGAGLDPGYIAAYPPGVRENGGQYTHGALWLLLALIRMGDGERAHRALRMLLPFNHSDTEEKALRYRVEPYVMAADVYDRPGKAGRGGWTWYTGSAAWLYLCLLELLGYERRENRVRLNALLGDWPRACVTVPFGKSRYRLVCDKEAARVTLDGKEVEGEFIELIDDGRIHEAVFPERKARRLR
ncbi:MAG: glucoamylase family protein [Clostridia bacterium]|nr:glucoamylase family protein [Clostridia bacterium]